MDVIFFFINSSYTDYEKKQILMCASVARYSLAYWNDVIQDQDNNWLGFLNCESALITKNNKSINFFEGYSDEEKLVAVGIADYVGFAITGGNVGAGITYSAVTAVVAWWDDIVDGIESFWESIFG